MGKTSLIKRMLFDEECVLHVPTLDYTLAAEFPINEEAFTVNLMDTGGLNEFPAMRDLALRSADMIVLIYSIDERHTFDTIARMRKEIIAIRGPSFQIAIVGNKSDLNDKRQVALPLTECTVRCEWLCDFAETSTKAAGGQGVLELFKRLLKRIGCNDAERTPQCYRKRNKSLASTLELKATAAAMSARQRQRVICLEKGSVVTVSVNHDESKAAQHGRICVDGTNKRKISLPDVVNFMRRLSIVGDKGSSKGARRFSRG